MYNYFTFIYFNYFKVATIFNNNNYPFENSKDK